MEPRNWSPGLAQNGCPGKTFQSLLGQQRIRVWELTKNTLLSQRLEIWPETELKWSQLLSVLWCLAEKTTKILQVRHCYQLGLCIKGLVLRWRPCGGLVGGWGLVESP